MGIQNLLGTLTLPSLLFAVAITLIIVYAIKSIFGGYKNLPPGPTGLPIVGYLPFMQENFHEQLIELGKKYGKIFSMKLGSRYGVVIDDYECLKELYATPEFLNKPGPGPLGLIPNDMGFGLTNGKVWDEQRKHSLMMMRNAGMGKSFFENEMQDEVRLVIKKIEEKNGKPCDITSDMHNSLMNIMWMLLFGHRLKPDDPKRKTLSAGMFLILDHVVKYIIAYFYDWTRHIIKFWNPEFYQNVMRHYRVFEQTIDEEINAKRKSLHERPPTDFTDFFLVEMEKHAKIPDTSFTESMMKGNVLLYFIAGIGSTQISVIWLLLTMAKYPDVQQKIYKELESLTGNTREPCWDDRKNTPFTMAVIHELQRWRTLAPTGDFRTCFTDMKFRGYDIPKDSMIFPRIWAAHNDKTLWEKPEEFMPERFLTENGKTFRRPPGFLAFTQGRRNCPGEQVALMQIYLFFTWIIQNFKVKPEPGKIIDVDTQHFKFIVVPETQNICFVKRH